MKMLEMTIPYKGDQIKIIGSGILPYAIHHGHVYFLLGQEESDNRYGVFGGRMKHSISVEETAITEFNEETLGVVLTSLQITDIITNKLYSLKFIGAAGENRYFVTYMVQIPFDENMKNKFRSRRTGLLDGTACALVPGCLDSRGRLLRDFTEKKAVEWFHTDDILNVALHARWNHPVEGIKGTPMFRRPFLSGLSGLVHFFNIRGFLRDLVWCESQTYKSTRAQVANIHGFAL